MAATSLADKAGETWTTNPARSRGATPGYSTSARPRLIPVIRQGRKRFRDHADRDPRTASPPTRAAKSQLTAIADDRGGDKDDEVPDAKSRALKAQTLSFCPAPGGSAGKRRRPRPARRPATTLAPRSSRDPENPPFDRPNKITAGIATRIALYFTRHSSSSSTLININSARSPAPPGPDAAFGRLRRDSSRARPRAGAGLAKGAKR